MKNEAEFSTITKNSIIAGFKIPDPQGMAAMTASKRAFDGIGMIKENDELVFLCWETKFLKSMGAFSLKRVEEHQDFYLREYRKAKSIKSWVILGVDVGRNDKRAYIFDWDERFGELYKKGFSIHKKYLEKLPYNEIHKKLFEYNNIITFEVLQSIYEEKLI